MIKIVFINLIIIYIFIFNSETLFSSGKLNIISVNYTTHDESKMFYDSIIDEKAPKCINFAEVARTLIYPDSAKQNGIEGKVSIKLFIGEDGIVIKTGSLKGPEVFYDEVRKKAINLIFTPGIYNGKPAKTWVTVPFNFKLK